MAFFRAQVGDKVYEVEKLTLGDARLLKRHYGLEDLSEFESGDPDILAGILFLALRREKLLAGETVVDAALMAEVDGLDIEEFGEAPDPPQAEEATPKTPAKTKAPRVKAGS